MNDALLALASISGAWLWQLGLVFLRVGAMVSVLPAFGAESVPVRIKLAVAFGFSLIVAPAVPTAPIPTGPLAFGTLAMIETSIGLALGIGVRMFVFALQTAGTMAAQSVSLSQILGGAGIDPIPAMGYVLVVAGLALAMMLGLHVRVAEFLILSYGLLPFGTLPGAQSFSLWGLNQVGRSFSLAFMLALPFVLGSMLYNVVIGVINRAMPQLMVAFVGAPLITFGGIFLLFLCVPIMLEVWSAALTGFFASPFAGGP